MLVKIQIPKGYIRLKVGSIIRTGDYSLDVREENNLRWFRWVLSNHEVEAWKVKPTHPLFIRKITSSIPRNTKDVAYP